MTPEEGLELLRDKILTAQCLIYPSGDDWWGAFVYTILDNKTLISSFDGECIFPFPTTWYSPEEICQMPIEGTFDTRNLDWWKHCFADLEHEFDNIRKPGMSDIHWLKDHPYYIRAKKEIVPVLKKDASEKEKMMAFFFAPKEEWRPENSAFKLL